MQIVEFGCAEMSFVVLMRRLQDVQHIMQVILRKFYIIEIKKTIIFKLAKPANN